MERSEHDSEPVRRQFPEKVDASEQRKIRSRREGDRNVWFGLGMFGIVGWSVAIPTLIGIFIGVWIDVTWPGPYSWTLMLLIVGIIIGCANAWFWVQRENRNISRDRETEPDKHDS